MAASTSRVCSGKSISAVLVVVHLASFTLAAQPGPMQLLALAGYVIVPSTPLQPLGIAERESVVARAKQLANERTRDLPNFFCDMTVQRTRLQVKSRREMWEPITEEILVRLRFVGWREDYKTLRIGRRRSGEPFQSIGKASLRTLGEFGGLLNLVKDMEFRWLGRARLGTKSVYVFNVAVPEIFGPWIRRGDRPGGLVAERGLICIEEESNHTLAIALEAVDIPLSYGIEMASRSVVFSETPIDGKTFLLPISSESIAHNAGEFKLRQSSRYGNYKKFDAESDLLFESIESKVTYTGQTK